MMRGFLFAADIARKFAGRRGFAGRILARMNRNRTICDETTADGSAPIEDQHAPDLADMRYGNYPVSYNACEVVAVYNAMLLTHRPVNLADLLAEFEANGLIGYFLFGKRSRRAGRFGTAPHKIKRWLKAHSVQFVKLSRAQFEASVSSPFERDPRRVYIVSYLNGGKLRRGVHTFAVCVDNGTITSFNGYKKHPACASDIAADARFITAFEIFGQE